MSEKLRILTPEFMVALKQGMLKPILERVQKDHTLMLAIRDGYVNIYYRGGNILKATKNGDSYKTFFAVQYAKSEQVVANPEEDIRNKADAQKLVACFSERKNIMDEYFAGRSKTTEQEFQQLVARENNNSSISNETEYFVSDIEVTVPHLTRFDIVAIRWLASQRKKGSNCRAALIEMKYGDGAIEGKAGLLEHLKDMAEFISNREEYTDLLKTMESQFNQLDELQLLDFNKGTSNAKVKLNPEDKPEVIFILANHNPRSTKLQKILSDPEFDKYEQLKLFDLILCLKLFRIRTTCKQHAHFNRVS